MSNQHTGRTPVLVRLQARISSTPTPRGCLEWSGSRTKKGYGRFNYGDDSSETTAHRALWLASGRSLAPDEHVAHTCDNPPCCNLDHLFAATPAQNEQDKLAKGRDGDKRNWGPKNGRWKHGRYAKAVA